MLLVSNHEINIPSTDDNICHTSSNHNWGVIKSDDKVFLLYLIDSSLPPIQLGSTISKDEDIVLMWIGDTVIIHHGIVLDIYIIPSHLQSLTIVESTDELPSLISESIIHIHLYISDIMKSSNKSSIIYKNSTSFLISNLEDDNKNVNICIVSIFTNTLSLKMERSFSLNPTHPYPTMKTYSIHNLYRDLDYQNTVRNIDFKYEGILSSMQCVKDMVFMMYSDNNIYIWSIQYDNPYLLGYVKVPSIYYNLTVAPNAQRVALYNSLESQVYIINLDQYFASCPHHLAVGFKECDNLSLLESGRIYIGPLNIPWYNRKIIEAPFVKVTSIYKKSGFRSISNKTEFTCGFSYEQSKSNISLQSDESIESSQVDLNLGCFLLNPKILISNLHDSYNIEFVRVTDRSIFVALSNEGNINHILCSQDTDKDFKVMHLSTSYPHAILMVPSIGDIWNISCVGKLYTIFREFTPIHFKDDIVSKLIISHSPHDAYELCTTNKWEDICERMEIKSLIIGLQSHNVDLIISSLKCLPTSLQLEGNQLLASYLRQYSYSVKDYFEFNKLLHVAISHTTSLIAIVSHNISSSHVQSIEWNKHLLILMNDLSFYRSINFLLNHRLLTANRVVSSLKADADYVLQDTFKNHRMTISFDWNSGSYISNRKEDTGKLHDNLLLLSDSEKVLSECGGEWPIRWADLSNEMVVVDSLKYNVVSTAMCFLALRERKIMNKSHFISAASFRGFAFLGGRFMYKLLCNDLVASLDICVKMVINLGEDAMLFFRDIAFYTGKRSLREKLLNHVSHTYGITEKDQIAVNFIKILEEIYPNMCYSVEFNRSWTRILSLSSHIGYIHDSSLLIGVEANRNSTLLMELFPCGDISDLHGVRSDGFKSITNYIDVSPDQATLKSDSNDYYCQICADSERHIDTSTSSSYKTCQNKCGYMHLELDWVDKFDQRTKEFILLESEYLMEFNVENTLCFYLSHNCVVDIKQWVWDWNHNDINMIGKNLKKGSFFSRELLLNELARKGIFECQESDFKDLIHRLTSCGSLFYSLNEDSSHALKNQFLPYNNMSIFHQSFLLFCIQNNYFHVFHEFCHYYNLKFSFKEFQVSSEWKCFLEGRSGYHSNLYNASLHNIYSSGDMKSITLNQLFLDGHILIALSSLMVAPVNSHVDCFNLDFDESMYISESVLRSAISYIPSLSASLFPLHISKDHIYPSFDKNDLPLTQAACRDISLLDILHDTATVDLISASQKQLYFSHPLLSNTAYKESLQAEFYLSQCRPTEAFNFIMKLYSLNISDLTPRLHLEIQKELLNIARISAMHNITNESILSSCTMFLHLFGLETETLRVDVEAASRIINYELCSKRSIKKDEVIDHVTDLFLRFPGSIDENITSDPEGPIILALEILGEASRYLAGNTENISSRKMSIAAFEIYPDSPWKLVTLFCRVHGLARSLALLHELGRRNDWVIFLHEAHRERCPIGTLCNIIKSIFSDHFLRDHLYISMETYSCEATGLDFPLDGLKLLNDVGNDCGNIFDFLMLPLCNGYSLLNQAVDSSQPLFAILASNFQDIDRNLCWAVWLAVSSNHEEMLPSFNLDFSSIKSLNLLNSLISLLIRKDQINLILESMFIYGKCSPLLSFIHFLSSFRKGTYQTAEAFFTSFCQSLKMIPCSWAYEFAVKEVEHFLSCLCCNSHEFEVLLNIMSRNEFHINKKKAFDVLKSVPDTDIISKYIFKEPKEILQMLLQKNYYGLARQYLNNGVNDIDIESSLKLVIEQEVEFGFKLISSNCLWSCSSEYRHNSLCTIINLMNDPIMRITFLAKIFRDYFHLFDKNEQVSFLCLLQHDDIQTQFQKLNLRPFHIVSTLIKSANILNLNLPVTLIHRSDKELDRESQVFLLSVLCLLIENPKSFHMSLSISHEYKYESYNFSLLKTAVAIAELVDPSLNSITKCFKLMKDDIDSSLISMVNSVLGKKENTSCPISLLQSRISVINLLRDASSFNIIAYAIQKISILCSIGDIINMNYNEVLLSEATKIFEMLISQYLNVYESSNDQIINLLKFYIKHFKLDENENEMVKCITDMIYKRLEENQITKTQIFCLISLCHHPENIGTEILSKFDVISPCMKSEFESELLIIAYHCFMDACELIGIERVLYIFQSKVKVWMCEGKYYIVIRILHETNEYEALNDVLNLLIEENYIHELLKQANEEQVFYIKLAVEKMNQNDIISSFSTSVYIKFKMYSQLASKLVKAGLSHISNINSNLYSSTNLEVLMLQQEIVTAMQIYAFSSEYYFLDGQVSEGNHCQYIFCLLYLQYKYLSHDIKLVVIGLIDEEHIQETFYKIKSYEDACIFSNAYGIKNLQKWKKLNEKYLNKV